jgi:hypothetical protein
MKDRIRTLKEWVEMYDRGEFRHRDRGVMVDAGWYDWFCTDGSLSNRMEKMVGMVKAAAESPFIDSTKVRIFFKNNCPMVGPTYDSFSIVDMETGDVLYWVTAKNGHKPQEAMVVKAPDFDVNVLPEGKRTVKEVKLYFKGPKHQNRSIFKAISSTLHIPS